MSGDVPCAWELLLLHVSVEVMAAPMSQWCMEGKGGYKRRASILTVVVSALLQAHYRDYGKMDFARSVFVIHNIAHQGRGPMAELAPLEVRTPLCRAMPFSN